MTPIYRVQFEPLAEEALVDAAAYIQEHSGPDRASNWLRSILSSISRLEALPKAFAPWTERDGHLLYSKPVPPYRVLYVVEDPSKTVHIIDVVHMARETRLASYRSPDA